MKYTIHKAVSAGLLVGVLHSAELLGAQQDSEAGVQTPIPSAASQDLIDDMGNLIQKREAFFTLADTFIASLERASELEEQRERALSSGGQTAISSNPDLLARLTEVVILLKDPRSIPALISVLGNGSTATPVALADFGELAVPGLIAAVSPPEGPSHRVHAGLLALRCLAEGEMAISPSSRAAIEDLVSKRLEMKQEFVTNLWRDIDLAIALGDPALRGTVELLASDEQALLDRGVTAPDLIQKTQSQARERLSGVAATPLCDDFRTKIDRRFAQ